MGRLILCCVAVALEIHAQAPAITGAGNDRISPGSIEYIFGSNFGIAGNTTVTVGGLNAKVLAVSSNQIRALFPPNLPAGPATLIVTVDGTVAETANVLVLAHAPAQVAIGKGSVSGGPVAQFHQPNMPETQTVPSATARPHLPSSSAAEATNGSGIVYTCDPSITALSATACNTLNTTIAGLYSSAFTNANASIYVTLVNGGAFANSSWTYNYGSAEYSIFRNALIASETDANDTTAITDSVPAVNPYASSSLGLVDALQRALGLSPGTGVEADGDTSCILGAAGCYDGTISLGKEGPWYFRTGVISPNQYDFFTFAEHETDEILGTASACCGSSSSGLVFPADYFRYHSNGTRSFAYGTDDPCSSGDSTNACFSIDGINMLQQYNNLNVGQDTGDWVYNCAHPLVQDYATCAGTAGVDISPAAEILVLDVIGYTLRNPSHSGGITSVTSSTPDGTYGVGASIAIQVAFSEPVTVTGAPQLALNSGGTAGYSFGSGTSTLTFIYAVAAGQNSTSLDYASTSSLTLNGGGIKVPSGTPESLTLAIPGTLGALGSGRAIVIDTLPTAITIQTNPPGLQFSVDGGVAKVAPVILSLTQGSHAIAVATDQSGGTCNGYSYSATATIHHEYVAANANNYTVTIAGTWPALATVTNGGRVTNAGGYDICFANPANTAKLSWELESYNGATGAIVAHVFVGSIGSTADTTFSIFYGNSSISAFQGGAAGAWDTSIYPYSGIWHLGNGTVLNGNDSSPNGNDLVNYGATATSGEIGGAAAFASASAEYMAAPASSSLDFSGPISVSVWENPASYAAVLASRTACNIGNWQIYDNSPDSGVYFNFWSGGQAEDTSTPTLLSIGVWSHVAITWDGLNARFYVNGSLTNTLPLSGPRNSNPNTFNVGTDSCSSYTQGSLDEIRIAQGAWPSTLIQTMYNNQSAPNAFVTLSGMVPVSSSAETATQYVFTGWSDGGAASHSITVGTSPATYTATFTTIGGVEGGGLSVPAVTALSANGYFAVFGANFAPAGTSRQLASSDVVNGSLPTNLGSTCVNVGPARAFPTYVSPSQINAIAPSLPTTRAAGVSVVVNCGTPNETTSPVVNVPLAAASPELLYWVQNASGQDPVIAVDAVHGDYIGPPGLIPGLTFRPAIAGDILTIYGIGFGPTEAGPVPGAIPSVADSVPLGYSVTIGGTTASASYVGITPTIAGLYQVNVTIPTGIAPGNYSIVLNVNGASTPAGAFLAIGP